MQIKEIIQIIAMMGIITILSILRIVECFQGRHKRNSARPRILSISWGQIKTRSIRCRERVAVNSLHNVLLCVSKHQYSYTGQLAHALSWFLQFQCRKQSINLQKTMMTIIRKLSIIQNQTKIRDSQFLNMVNPAKETRTQVNTGHWDSVDARPRHRCWLLC